MNTECNGTMPSPAHVRRLIAELNAAGYEVRPILSSPPADDVREALTDVEAIESLPTRSVVMDGGGEVWRKLVTGLWACLDTNGDPPAEESHTVLWQSAPPRVAVLWRPAAEVRPYGTVTDTEVDWEYRAVAREPDTGELYDSLGPFLSETEAHDEADTQDLIRESDGSLPQLVLHIERRRKAGVWVALESAREVRS